VSEAWANCKDVIEKERQIQMLTRQNQQFEFILRQRLLS
jgi:hypothetical protein